jgi:sugar (pentulose or hexulose) kinase
VTAAERAQRHQTMTTGEEHYALAWLREHQPTAFDRAADYVDQIRRLDEGVRKEARP